MGAPTATRPDAGPIITALDAAAYTVPTDEPEADGTLDWAATSLVLVTARASDRTVGHGWTYGAPACADLVRGLLAGVVRWRDALAVTDSYDAMTKAVRNVGRAGVAGCAVSAVDLALWDLKARILDLPLHRLLGQVRADVPVYGSGGFTGYTDQQTRDQLLGWVEGQAIPRVKIKIGECWGCAPERDLARIALARAAIGAEAELFVDADGAYTRKQAVRVLRDAAPAEVSWFEEPVSSDDLAGLRAVRDAVPADVTAGEYGYDLPYFERMCRAGAVDCLMADVTRCGGVTEWTRVAAVAAAHGLEISGHCAPHLHAQVAAATPNLRHLEWFHDHVRIETRLFDGALDPQGGTITPRPDAPGHGMVPRTADLERYLRR